MKRATLLHQWWLHCITILRQAPLHHPTPTSTLLHQHLHLLGMSRYSMSSNLFGPYWQKGEKYMSWESSSGSIWVLIFCWVLTTLILETIGFWVVTLKLDGRLPLLLLPYEAMINPAWSHSADDQFSLCMSLSSLLSYMHDELYSWLKISTKQNMPCAFAFKGKLLICTSSGGASYNLWRQCLCT